MKIDYVVVSTDNNPFYDGYWELVKKTWKDVAELKTILVTVGNEDYHEIFDDCELIGYKKVEDIPTSFQAQIARLFVTKTYINKTFLISDLDMVPLSKSYFIDNAEKADETSLLIYTSDAYGYNNQKRYPMCYNLAKGKVYNEILDLDCSFVEFVHRVKTLGFQPLWDSDELYFGKCVYEFENKSENKHRLVKLQRGFKDGYATFRIDRDYWGREDFSKIREGYFIDSHLIRPYESNKKEISDMLFFLYN